MTDQLTDEQLTAMGKYWSKLRPYDVLDQPIIDEVITVVSELLELRKENEVLRKALKDCMSYIDVDNLTMQHKERAWQTVLHGGPYVEGNVKIVQ